MAGKGSKRRKENEQRFKDNYDKINWGKKQPKQPEPLKGRAE